MGVTHRIRSYIPEHVIADGNVNFVPGIEWCQLLFFLLQGREFAAACDGFS